MRAARDADFLQVAEYLNLQLVADAFCYLRLECEHIANVAIEGLRPDGRLVGRSQ